MDGSLFYGRHRRRFRPNYGGPCWVVWWWVGGPSFGEPSFGFYIEARDGVWGSCVGTSAFRILPLRRIECGANGPHLVRRPLARSMMYRTYARDGEAGIKTHGFEFPSSIDGFFQIAKAVGESNVMG